MNENRLESNKGYLVSSCGGIGMGFGGCSKHFTEYSESIGYAMGWVNQILINTVNEFTPYEVIIYKNRAKDDLSHNKEDVIFHWRNYEPLF